MKREKERKSAERCLASHGREGMMRREVPSLPCRRGVGAEVCICLPVYPTHHGTTLPTTLYTHHATLGIPTMLHCRHVHLDAAGAPTRAALTCRGALTWRMAWVGASASLPRVIPVNVGMPVCALLLRSSRVRMDNDRIDEGPLSTVYP